MLSENSSDTSSEQLSETQDISSESTETEETPNTLGRWISTSVSSEGVVTTTNDAVEGPPEMMEFSGTSFIL